MLDESDEHHRRSIRLPEHDYSLAGWYFVTIVTQGHICLFGEVTAGEITLNDIGHLIERCWNEIPSHFPNVQLDAFVIMPNHIHGIIIITDSVGAGLVPAQSNPAGLVPAQPGPGATTRVAPTLGDIVGAFKSVTTVEYIRGVKQGRWMPFHKRLWQRNYYEHIIRNERELEAARQYIHDNPANWTSDAERPALHQLTI